MKINKEFELNTEKLTFTRKQIIEFNDVLEIIENIKRLEREYEYLKKEEKNIKENMKEIEKEKEELKKMMKVDFKNG